MNTPPLPAASERRLLARRAFIQRAVTSMVVLGGVPLIASCSSDEASDEPDTNPPPSDGTSLPAVTGLETTDAVAPAQAFAVAMQSPQAMVPGLAFDLGSQTAALTGFTGIYSFDAGSLEPIPIEAVDYRTEDGGLTHILTLKSGMTWSDGAPHVAGDYVFGARFRFDQGLLFDPPWLVGVLESFDGGTFDDFGIEAPDDETLIFRTTNPIPFFQSWLAGEYNYWALPPHVLQTEDDVAAFNTGDVYVCNGPYQLESLDDQQMRFVRNAAFPGSPPNADELTFVFYPGTRDAAAYTAFRAGELDVATLSILDLPNALNDPNQADRITTIEWQNPLAIVLNHASGPLGDVRVRKALYMGIDREAIAESVFRGTATTAYQLLGPAYAGHDPERRPFPVSVDEARRLLAEAGFENGEGFPTFSYQNLAVSGLNQLAQVIQEMWRETLGINITIEGVDAATYSERIFGPAGSWGDMSDLSWPEYYHDPADTLYGLYSFGGLYVQYGWTGHTDELQAQQDAAVFETDPARRQELLADYDFTVLEQVPIIPVVFWNDAQIRQTDVEGAFAAYGPNLVRAHQLTRL